MSDRKYVVSSKNLILFLCLSLFILRDFIRVAFGKYVYSLDGWTFERFSGPLVVGIIISGIVFLCLYVLQYGRKKGFPLHLKYGFYIITILTVFWTFHSLFTVPGYSITTLDGTAKTIWICMLGMWIGYDDDSWSKIVKWLPLLSLLYLSMSFYYVFFVRFGVIAGDTTNQRPYWMLYSTGFWIFAYCLLCERETIKRRTSFLLITMLLNLLIVAFTISRGWLFQTIFLYAYFLTRDTSISKKRKTQLTFLFVIIIGIGVYVLKDQIIASITDYIYKFTMSRSRDTQFEAFFSQVPISRLITGGGEYASYSYKRNANYIYIDNSYLYYAFHFGIVFSLTMFLTALRTSIQSLRVRRINSDGNIGIVILMWIAALLGASVYCAGYEVSMRLLFIMILIGRAAYIARYPSEKNYNSIELEK